MASKSFPPFLVVQIVAIVLLNNIPSLQAYQVDYNNESYEYCYTESFNLGTCLGKHIKDDEAQILRCSECSGQFNGDETCSELKALNDISKPHIINSSKNDTTTANIDNSGDSIDWNDSFCEQYNKCVEQNCPKQCWHEQDKWIQCMIIELDCDWRCKESEVWLVGDRMIGMLGNKGAAVVGRRRIVQSLVSFGIIWVFDRLIC